jgi:hypothetical protein
VKAQPGLLWNPSLTGVGAGLNLGVMSEGMVSGPASDSDNVSRRRLKRGVVAGSVVGLLAGLIWIVASGPRQPVYRGKALEVWLRTYAPRSPYQLGSPKWKETDDAVRQMGTNCIPTLVRMIRARDSSLKVALVALAQRQHVIKVRFVPAAERNIEASRAFVALGEAGSDAVPLLMEAYEKNVTQQSRYAIADALAWIGPSAKAAVPLLLVAATNSDTRLRANALWALGDIHSQPELCVPVLIRALGDSKGQARLCAAHALGGFGADARPAIQRLTELAKPGAELAKASAGTSTFVFTDEIAERFEARRALERIGPAVESLPDFGVPTADSPAEPR